MLTRPWLVAIWLLILTVVQVTVLPQLVAIAARPQFLLVFTTLAGFIGGSRFGMTVGAISGFVLDVLNGRFVGLHLLTLSSAGFGGGLLTRHVYRDNAPAALLAVSLATVWHELLSLGIMRSFGMPLQVSAGLSSLPTLISVNLAATVLIYPFMLRQAQGMPVPGSEDENWTLSR